MRPTSPIGEPQYQTPQEKVSTLKVQIADLLQRIEKKTYSYGRGEDLNYSHVGSLAYVKEQLETITKFLKA